MSDKLKQQVEVTVKLTFSLDAEMHQEDIAVYTREGLYAGFEDQAEFVDGHTMVDVLDIKEEAEIYGLENELNEGPIKALEDILGLIDQRYGEMKIKKIATAAISKAKGRQ